jgi:hypothetical protein
MTFSAKPEREGVMRSTAARYSRMVLRAFRSGTESLPQPLDLGCLLVADPYDVGQPLASFDEPGASIKDASY